MGTHGLNPTDRRIYVIFSTFTVLFMGGWFATSLKLNNPDAWQIAVLVCWVGSWYPRRLWLYEKIDEFTRLFWK
jgi:hypothetical protein